jgi:RNA polymerase sigma-70 factor (ECF subfamily)
MQVELEEALPRAYVAAFRWLGSREESHDACQEAAARVLASVDRYDPERPFYPWFYRILRNLCMDRLKGRGRSAVVLQQLKQIAPPTGSGSSAERRLLEQERFQALASAIEELPEELREVIELRHFQDLSYEEMAEIIGCPIGTVMSRLYRARKELRERLRAAGDFYPTGGDDERA